MSQIHILTASEQVANRLHEESARGTWTGSMSGTHKLAQELGVELRTVASEGLLQIQTLPPGTSN